MNYKSVGNKRLLGIVVESPGLKGCTVVIDDSDCELILFDRKTNAYYKVLQLAAESSSSEHAEVLFDLAVDLEDEEQVEFKGK